MRGDVLALFQPGWLGRGVIEEFTVGNPAGGANFTRTTPGGRWERLISLLFVLTSGAGVANRDVAVEFQDGDQNAFGGSAAGVFQTASVVTRYYFGLNLNPSGAVAPTRQAAALPWLFLQPGDRIVSNIGALDATDQISAIRGRVEVFSVGQDGFPLGEANIADTTRGPQYEYNLRGE